MIEMHNQEFKTYYLSLPGVHPWYYLLFRILPRAFEYQGMIFLNVDAFYLNARDQQLLIMHEQGHLDSKEHAWIGIMSDNAFVRYLTS